MTNNDEISSVGPKLRWHPPGNLPKAVGDTGVSETVDGMYAEGIHMTCRLVFAVSLLLTVESYAKDRDKCIPVKGRLVTSWTTESCSSPLGLCTVGSVQGGPLHGAKAFFTVTAIGPTPEDPAQENSLAYSGPLVLETRRATLTVETMGLFDKSNALTTSQSRALTGGGSLQNGSGFLYTLGVATATGFDSRLQGKVCVGH